MEKIMAQLHLEYYKQSGSNQDKIPVNQDIMNYIKTNHDEDYSQILAKDDRWEVFYHLSQMRTSVLNWYEFKEESSILELGGEFGALTGLFCDRCKNVTAVEYGAFKAWGIYERYKNRENLDIYAGNLADIKFSKKYDYIAMIGCLERQCGGSREWRDYANYLKTVKELLKPEGKLLIAVENKYGLRYFCGETERYTKKPFGGINQYEVPAKGYTFGRHELEVILKEAGFDHSQFYYPLPDYKLAQMIYSDEYLPQKDLGERLLFYRENSSTLLVQEQRLYADIIDNHVFPFFANSFLVECGMREGRDSTAVFAAVTTDRGKKCGLSTSIHRLETDKEQWIVKKRALYPEGRESIENLYNNIKDIECQGIPVITHTMYGDTVVMPYAAAPTCSDYLRQVAKEGKREVFEYIFEQIHENIRRSSAISDRNDFPGADKGTLDYGIILKHCYIDMIPFNCFVVGGKLEYFDQEFVRENYPMAYPMFRALLYTYAFVPEAEYMVPLDTMKERYGLTLIWEELRKEEDRFVAQNRQYDVYQNFYKWTSVDIAQMNRNAELLGNEIF